MKKSRAFRLGTRIIIFSFLIIFFLMPVGELYAFEPDYPDFIWTFNSKPRKIPGGTQKAVYL